MNQSIKDAYTPHDGHAYQIIRLIMQEKHTNLDQDVSETMGESYRRIKVQELQKFINSDSQDFIPYSMNDEGIIEFKSQKISNANLNYDPQNHHHAIPYLAEKAVVTDVLDRNGEQLPAFAGKETIKKTLMLNGKIHTNTAEYLHHSHMKNGTLHSPVLKDGSCKHAIVDNNTYTYEDGRNTRQIITSQHALDGKITDILQPNGQIAWAKNGLNVTTGQKYSLSIVGGVKQKVLAIPTNVLTIEQRKKLAHENVSSFNPMRPIAVRNHLNIPVLQA